MRLICLVTTAAALLLPLTGARAATDPVGDFLPTYTGPQNADVDLISGNVGLTGSNFTFSILTNGTVGATPNALYVWAINRGAGIARPAIAPPAGASLLWDAVVVMLPNGTLRVVTLPSAGAPTITSIPGGTSIAGNSLYAIVSSGLLPSTGFTPANYTFDLWSRVRVNPLTDGATSEVADLLDASPLRAVPEPGTWMMMVIGFSAIGMVARRRVARGGPRAAASALGAQIR